MLGSENDPRPVVGILGSHAPPSEMRKQLLAGLIIASCGGGIQDGKWSVGLDAQIGPQGRADLGCVGSTSGSQMRDSPWVQRRGSSQVANQSQV